MIGLWLQSSVCSSNVWSIMTELPSDIIGLKYHIYSIQSGYPILPINITNRGKFKNLKILHFSGGLLEMANSIEFNSDTFSDLTEMRDLCMNIKTSNDKLNNVVKYMRGLETLDFTGMKRLNTDIIRRMVAELSPTNLTRL